MNISYKLTLIRKTRNMTQAKFAESLGILRSNLANIEFGREPNEPVVGDAGKQVSHQLRPSFDVRAYR